MGVGRSRVVNEESLESSWNNALVRAQRATKKGKGGRKIKRIDADLRPRIRKRLTRLLSPSIVVKKLGRCSPLKIVWQATCGVLNHIVVRSVYAVTKNPKGLECTRCGASCDTGRVSGVSSSHERAAWRALRGLAAAWCVEVRLIPMWRGAIDIYLPFAPGSKQRIDLVIMVDGEGHFNEANKIHGISISKQSATDREFDRLAKEQRLSTLRLHYKDRDNYKTIIHHAIDVLLSHGQDKFPMYSRNLNVVDGEVV